MSTLKVAQRHIPSIRGLMYPDMLLLLPRGYRVKGGVHGVHAPAPGGGVGGGYRAKGVRAPAPGGGVGGTEQRGYVLLLSAGGYRARGYLLLLPEGGYGTGYIKSCQSGTGISFNLVFCC